MGDFRLLRNRHTRLSSEYSNWHSRATLIELEMSIYFSAHSTVDVAGITKAKALTTQSFWLDRRHTAALEVPKISHEIAHRPRSLNRGATFDAFLTLITF
jgi:hypothetical protein